MDLLRERLSGSKVAVRREREGFVLAPRRRQAATQVVALLARGESCLPVNGRLTVRATGGLLMSRPSHRVTRTERPAVEPSGCRDAQDLARGVSFTSCECSPSLEGGGDDALTREEMARLCGGPRRRGSSASVSAMGAQERASCHSCLAHVSRRVQRRMRVPPSRRSCRGTLCAADLADGRLV